MTVLNDADAIMLGLEPADAVYVGEVKIWPSGFEPSGLAGLALWYDAADLAALTTTWPDKSGLGHHAAVVGSPAPVLVPAVLNGQAVVEFKSNEGRVQATGTGVDRDWTLVYVARIVWAASRVIGALYPPPNMCLGFHGGMRDAAFCDGVFTPDVRSPAVPGEWKLYAADAAGPAASYVPRLFSNGAYLCQAPAAGGSGWAGTFCMSGYSPDSWNGSETSDCQIAEAILYNRKLPDTERQQVESYLRDKWGLP